MKGLYLNELLQRMSDRYRIDLDEDELQFIAGSFAELLIDTEMGNIFLNTKTRKTRSYAPPCDNCKITFSDFLMPNGGN